MPGEHAQRDLDLKPPGGLAERASTLKRISNMVMTARVRMSRTWSNNFAASGGTVPYAA